jgi:hypothetical protein
MEDGSTIVPKVPDSMISMITHALNVKVTARQR